MKFGLEEDTINKINGVFRQHENIEEVIIYGSRAKGNYKTGSDIDLTIKSKTVTLTELLQVENQMDDILLAYKIDLSLFHQISNDDLIDHINRIGSVFYKKD
ncbi:MAG: nucleotidyltransferase domain-containing protein [Bacteroidetes bacterium]|nr:MAG: nucleotidyltransferase domain-containing protein [Bacteroidota bacterium]